ncbi:hypothetical protein HY949_01105 [Candidatus Gottesmanbacteria bacterium]|nr:hypothetical protein [Candidatus Gottesmanbacteria bacterium]
MKEIESIPSLWYQSDPQRINLTTIPLGWVTMVEPLRPYSANLFSVIGASGTGRDTLIDAMIVQNPSLVRIRRTTTRAQRYPGESLRIDTRSKESFASIQENQVLLCPYRYPANNKWYGIPFDELSKILNGPALLEGTAEPLPLKMLLPDSTAVIIVPNSFDQLCDQLLKRDGDTPETQRRIERSQRELALLVNRIPSLIQTNRINGIVINDDTPEFIAERVLTQMKTKNWDTEIPSQLRDDVSDYLSTWNAGETTL